MEWPAGFQLFEDMSQGNNPKISAHVLQLCAQCLGIDGIAVFVPGGGEIVIHQDSCHARGHHSSKGKDSATSHQLERPSFDGEAFHSLDSRNRFSRLDGKNTISI